MLKVPFESSYIEKKSYNSLKLNHKFGDYFNPNIMMLTHALVYVS